MLRYEGQSAGRCDSSKHPQNCCMAIDKPSKCFLHPLMNLHRVPERLKRRCKLIEKLPQNNIFFMGMEVKVLCKTYYPGGKIKVKGAP